MAVWHIVNTVQMHFERINRGREEEGGRNRKYEQANHKYRPISVQRKQTKISKEKMKRFAKN